MADDYKYLDLTGTIVPDTSTLQTEVENEYKTALGQDIPVTPNTPQGVMITGEVTARSNVLRNNALVANQINPNLAGGVFLDAIWALTGGQRFTASKSVVPGAQLTGLPGTFIPAGSQASLADGTVFESVAAVTLDDFGLATVDFQAVEAGPVAVNPGALTQIVTAILGWDQITNAVAGVAGRAQESDLASRLRRRNTLSLQNVGLPLAITSALYNLSEVKSLTFRENYTDTDATIDGIFLLKHSVWACVDGGTDAQVAATLLANKSLGANWNGVVSVVVVEPASGQSYTVKFDRPTAVPVAARVTIRNPGNVTNAPEVVRAAILAYANGELEGEPGLVVGGNVSAFEFAGAVNRQAPGLYVQLCEVSLASPLSFSTAQIPIALNQKATILSGAIEVIEV